MIANKLHTAKRDEYLPYCASHHLFADCLGANYNNYKYIELDQCSITDGDILTMKTNC